LATLLAMTANFNRNPKDTPKPFEVYDFAPWLRPDNAQTEISDKPVSQEESKLEAERIDAEVAKSMENMKAVLAKMKR